VFMQCNVDQASSVADETSTCDNTDLQLASSGHSDDLQVLCTEH